MWSSPTIMYAAPCPIRRLGGASTSGSFGFQFTLHQAAFRGHGQTGRIRSGIEKSARKTKGTVPKKRSGSEAHRGPLLGRHRALTKSPPADVFSRRVNSQIRLKILNYFFTGALNRRSMSASDISSRPSFRSMSNAVLLGVTQTRWLPSRKTSRMLGCRSRMRK